MGIVTISLSLVVARSELSERVLRLALWPATIAIGAMIVALIAVGIEGQLLTTYAPHIFSSSVSTGVGDVVMAAAIIWAAFALWRGFRARNLASA